MTQPIHKELHRIAITAIIHRDGPKGREYLILKRSPDKKAFPGKWTVPGGGLETDDYINTPKTTGDHWYFALENTLRREVKEECGLEAGKVSYLLDMTFVRADGIPVLILSFYAPYKSGEVKLDEDNVEFAWATLEELKKYDLIEGLLGEIERVESILSTVL